MTDELLEQLRHVDLHDDLLTADMAATIAGVAVTVVWQWKRRGHLTPAGADEFGHPLYLGIDVLRAEAKTRKAARRSPAPWQP